ncbi:hypothetical protein NDU88_009019 [Pleurodeles waltl]|uniref:Uncharacterized protein n=1 Tax=Pleurodeles waltl TaxID=8319 RepID=A0AAV7QTL4_PLEWA|nr:hypothetical protein NDU88_009019 [Pleurodeles waltl]
MLLGLTWMCLRVQPIQCARVRLRRKLGAQRAKSRSREGRRRVFGRGSEVWERRVPRTPRMSSEGLPGSKS